MNVLNHWMLKSFFTVVSSAVITVTSSSGFVLHLWCVNWMWKGLGNLCFHWQDFQKIPKEPRMSLLHSHFKLKHRCWEVWMQKDSEAGTVDSEGKTVRHKAKEIDRKWDARQCNSEVKPKAVWCFIVNHTLYTFHTHCKALHSQKKKQIQKLSLGWYPFNSYGNVPFRY